MARRGLGGPFPYSYGLSSSYTSGPVDYHHEREPPRDLMREPMREQMREPMRDSMRDPMRDPMRDQMREPMRDQMRDSMRDPMGPLRDGPMRDNSMRHDDYRDSTFNELSSIRDDPQGKKLYSTLERLNSSSTGEGASDEIMRLFPPPPKRPCPTAEKPVYKNGHCIPRKDALLVEMIMNDKATLKAQLDVTKQAIVGLDFVTEFIDPEGGIRVYECSLCKTFRTVHTIMEHLTGYNHRVNYIQKQFPSEVKMFLLPDGRNKNRNKALMTVASKRCSELELVYGRGDLNVVNEKPKMPEGALDAPESDVLPEDKKLDELKKDLKKYSELKLETHEEFRLVKSLSALLTNAMCEFKYSQEQQGQSAE